MATVRIGLAQIDCMVGDVPGNVRRVIRWANRHRKLCDLIVFPELTLTGYPPEDLLIHIGFREQIEQGLRRIQNELVDIQVLVGHPEYQEKAIYNACSLIAPGETRATYRKRLLPNYGVFDEKRYFSPGSEPVVIDIAGLPIGLSICEDAWQPEPIADAVEEGARLIINVNASPFCLGKLEERDQILSERADDNGVSIVYLNLVGGQDELVFDGSSFAVNKAGEVVDRLPAFEEHFAILKYSANPGSRGRYEGRQSISENDLIAEERSQGEGDTEREVPAPSDARQRYSVVWGSEPEPLDRYPEPEKLVYDALVLAIRDYVTKNNFKGVLVGLSGGVDSALTLTLAVDALGSAQVTAVLMPSMYTSELSSELAAEQVRTHAVKSYGVSIQEPFDAFMTVLHEVFEGLPQDVTEENIQARCRGVILMAISNKSGKLVLTTGNKSEYAVGYATLYGDMAGGFAPLKDVSKTMVYRLAHYRNRLEDSNPIPERVLTREPSAELSANQKDTDTLPPYPVLDAILEGYIEKDLSPAELREQGFELPTIRKVVDMVKRNEYKRRQAPPGVKISPLAFGRERRYPITSGFNLDWDLFKSAAHQGNDRDPKPEEL